MAALKSDAEIMEPEIGQRRAAMFMQWLRLFTGTDRVRAVPSKSAPAVMLLSAHGMKK